MHTTKTKLPPTIREMEVSKMPVITCPHCGTGTNFTLRAQTPSQTKPTVECAIGRCEVCEKEVWFELERADQSRVLTNWPVWKEGAQEELPPNVKRAFDEALDCSRVGAWNGALCMCRRAIDDALTDLGAPEKGDLPTKLKALVESNVIAPPLKDWADQARIGGKLAAHGTGGDEWGQPDKDWADENDCNEVIEFCRSFFEYAYVMKARLDHRRGLEPESQSETKS